MLLVESSKIYSFETNQKLIDDEISPDELIIEMSSFLPSIDNVRKSSLVSAKRIYSAMDYLEGATSNGRSRKKRTAHKKSKKPKPPPTEQNPREKVERTKEYSRELKSRKEKAKLAREESLARHQNQEELKEKGLREKRRLNELFSVYAAQQGPSYRDSAKVVKPKFPILMKSTKSSVISRDSEKTPYSPLPNLPSVNKLDRDPQE